MPSAKSGLLPGIVEFRFRCAAGWGAKHRGASIQVAKSGWRTVAHANADPDSRGMRREGEWHEHDGANRVLPHAPDSVEPDLGARVS